MDFTLSGSSDRNENENGRIWHLRAPQDGELSAFLQKHFLLNHDSAQELIKLGAIYIERERVLRDQEVKAQSYLRVHLEPKRFPLSSYQLQDRILYQNQNFVILNKPGGLPCIPTLDNYLENTLRGLESELGRPLYPTHRLDIATSGLILYAKTQEFQRFFNTALARGKVQKTYQARVSGECTLRGLLTHYMKPDPRSPKIVSREAVEGWSECRLEILDSNYDGPESVLTIRLWTGRTHQIRAQLSHEAFPIIGDTLYGSSIALDRRVDLIGLTAVRLSFLEFDFQITPQNSSYIHQK